MNHLLPIAAAFVAGGATVALALLVVGAALGRRAAHAVDDVWWDDDTAALHRQLEALGEDMRRSRGELQGLHGDMRELGDW